MFAGLRQLWRRHRLLVLAFALALAVSAFFLVRMVVFALHWADPAHQDQAIAAWMPLRYVARSWDVPPEVLGRALGMDPAPGRRRTVGDIAAARGVAPEVVAGRLRAAIADHRAEDGDE